MSWFGDRASVTQRAPWIASGSNDEGIYALRGNGGALQTRLESAKRAVDLADQEGTKTDQAQAVKSYNAVLAALLPCLDPDDLPLDRRYLIDEARTLLDYLELKKACASKQPFTFEQLLGMPRCVNIALIRVLSGRTISKEQVKVELLESFRGQWTPRQSVLSSGMPGFGIDWFRAGETAFVFCSSRYVSLGEVGRMPVWRSGGSDYVCSFTKPSFWMPLQPNFDHGCSFVLVDDVRKRLRNV